MPTRCDNTPYLVDDDGRGDCNRLPAEFLRVMVKAPTPVVALRKLVRPAQTLAPDTTLVATAPLFTLLFPFAMSLREVFVLSPKPVRLVPGGRVNTVLIGMSARATSMRAGSQPVALETEVATLWVCGGTS